MGQLLVVFFGNLPTLLAQLELIPDPWYVPDNLTSGAKDLGSDVGRCGYKPL